MWRRLPKRARGEYLADELVLAFLDRAYAQVAVVDDDDATHLDVLDQVRVVAVDRNLNRARLALDREADPVADLQVVGLLHVAGANGRPLCVEQQRDLLVDARGNGADILGDLAHLVVVRVRHVEAEDIHAHADEPLEGGGAPGGRSERGDNFGTAHKREEAAEAPPEKQGVCPAESPVSVLSGSHYGLEITAANSSLVLGTMIDMPYEDEPTRTS